MKRRIAIGAVLVAVIALGAAMYAFAAPGAGAAGTATPNTIAPQAITMTVTGAKQSVFSKTAIPVTTLSHEIVSPRDAASGLPTGRRQHMPISVTMDWGPTTPKFITSLVSNETLTSVMINLLSNGIKVATIKLTNGNVGHFVEKDQTVQFDLYYQKIQWTWLNGGISALDDWEQFAP